MPQLKLQPGKKDEASIALERSYRLLCDHLSPRQIRELSEHGYFTFRVYKGIFVFVFRCGFDRHARPHLFARRIKWARLCTSIRGYKFCAMPVYDQLLALKIAAERTPFAFIFGSCKYPEDVPSSW